MNIRAKDLFEGKLRLRACGICLREDSILLVKHAGLGTSGELWSPPGGGIHYNESAEEAVVREIKEETGLDSKVKNLLFVNEYFNGKLHAIELFFESNIINGSLIVGEDPELAKEDQMIKEARFVSFEELNQLPDEKKHNLLRGRLSKKVLLNMNGYFKLWQ